MTDGWYPPPLGLTWARFWFGGQKYGLPCVGKPVLLRGTYHGTHVADISQPSFTTTKGCPTRRHTPHNTRAHGITAAPTLCHPHGPLPQPARRYKPHSRLDRKHKNDGSKTGPEVRRHGVAVFGQAHVSAGGGGGGWGLLPSPTPLPRAQCPQNVRRCPPTPGTTVTK